MRRLLSVISNNEIRIQFRLIEQTINKLKLQIQIPKICIYTLFGPIVVSAYASSAQNYRKVRINKIKA